MSSLSKVLYLCLILVLAWLAVMPYWPTIKGEAKNFYATWQVIRSEGTQDDEAQETDELAEATTRERSIATPTPPEELPVLAKAEPGDKTLDPFLAEARERALADPEAAMQWLQEQSRGAERLRGMLEVVALWAADDSEAALLWLESNAQGLARLETLNSGIELWAQRDPRAAASWIDGMANDQSKVSAAKSLASTWVKQNPAEASKWVSGLLPGAIRDEALTALALSWVEADPQSALRWAATNETSITNESQESLYNTLIGIYAKNAPNEAEAYIRELPVDPFAADSNQYYVQELVKAKAELDPIQTAEWLQGLAQNDPINHPENVRSLMQVWTEADSIAASAWLSEQPAGRARDAAIAGFAESIQRFEPEAAASWANTISAPEQRVELLTNSIRSWAKRDPQSALKWVINAELSPALEEQLGREIGAD